jgi:hypothetical protein
MIFAKQAEHFRVNDSPAGSRLPEVLSHSGIRRLKNKRNNYHENK